MRRLLPLLLALALALSFPALVRAGDGAGGNSGEPITLVSCSLQDGSVIEGDALSVHLEFNKNVVHFSVRETNTGSFHLYDESGNSHPLEVLMGDDQVDPGAKRLVDLSATGLQPGSYTLVIAKGLTAKNGTVLERDITIRFSVADTAAESPADAAPPDDEPGEAAQEQPGPPEPAGEGTAQAVPAQAETAQAAPATGQTAAGGSGAQAHDAGGAGAQGAGSTPGGQDPGAAQQAAAGGLPVVAGVIVLAVVGAGVAVFVRSRAKAS